MPLRNVRLVLNAARVLAKQHLALLTIDADLPTCEHAVFAGSSGDRADMCITLRHSSSIPYIESCGQREVGVR